MLGFVKKILGMEEETPFYGDKHFSAQSTSIDVKVPTVKPWGKHIAFCTECRVEREFPLQSSECPVGIDGNHRCSDHMAEAFEHFKGLKDKRLGLSSTVHTNDDDCVEYCTQHSHCPQG